MESLTPGGGAPGGFEEIPPPSRSNCPCYGTLSPLFQNARRCTHKAVAAPPDTGRRRASPLAFSCSLVALPEVVHLPPSRHVLSTFFWCGVRVRAAPRARSAGWSGDRPLRLLPILRTHWPEAPVGSGGWWDPIQAPCAALLGFNEQSTRGGYQASTGKHSREGGPRSPTPKSSG